VILLLALLAAAEVNADAERAAWAYKRPVTSAGAESLAALVLPPELSARAAAGGRDFRLVDETGREVAYLFDWTSEREGLTTWRAGMKDLRREREEPRAASPVRSQWTLDLGQARSFTELDLNLEDGPFAWHVRVEASLDGKEFETVQAEAALFDQTWNQERVRKTRIRFDEPVRARYLRLTARSAARTPFLEILGASVTLRRRLKGDAWSMDVGAEPSGSPDPSRPGVTRYRLNASSLLPFDEVEIRSEEGAFLRKVSLVEVSEGGTKPDETRLGEGTVFRVRASGDTIAGESVRIPVREGSGGVLYLDIDNADSPPLRGLKVRLHGARVRLVFPAVSDTLTLYYGNPSTRAPVYDLEGLRPRLAQITEARIASLGAEVANPLFKREPPLRFAATLGASVDPSRWRRERAIAPLPEEDVYALTLKAADLAALKPDLGDLRVVDLENRQVPYLLDHDFADERVPLAVRKQASAPGAHSLYRLEPPAPVEGEGHPRLTRIEMEIADAFFERPARLLEAEGSSSREVPFSLVMSRKPPARDSIVLGTNAPLANLVLEIDDGDNAPLDLRSAVAVVRVPRIVFKAAPGTLRLLLGNPGAETPRYDIAGLRSELLAYSAIAAHAGSLADNEGSRPSLLSRFQGVPGNTLVWIAIIVAIIALVALTLKTLKGA
jgi:hypothetical protein